MSVTEMPWLKPICQQLADNDPCLTTLDFHAGGIGYAGVKALANALPGNSSLKVLILSYNGITAMGAKILAALFEQNSTSITTLYLEGNCLGDDGIEALASALSDKTSIKVLNVARNGIGNAGGVAIARMLQEDGCCIQKLYMYGNPVGDEGARALGTALKFNGTLCQFCVKENEFGPAGRQHVLEGLQSNFSLRTCFIDTSMKRETDYYTKLNRGGRFLLREHNLPVSFWTHVFAKVRSEVDLMYCFVHSNPGLFKRDTHPERLPEKSQKKSIRKKLGQLAAPLRQRR